MRKYACVACVQLDRPNELIKIPVGQFHSCGRRVTANNGQEKAIHSMCRVHACYNFSHRIFSERNVWLATACRPTTVI